MKSIILVSTIHKENGAANVSNLHQILDQILPEVIFLEVSPKDFKHYEAASGLEPAAVREYKRHHDVILIPVDLATTDKSVFAKFNDLFQVIDANSPVNFQEKDQDIQRKINEFGFSYLNSNQCTKDMDELNDQELDVVHKINHPKITASYADWNIANSLRENEMINKIYEYCQTNKFQKSVFLVGAAHRGTIISKIKDTGSFDSESVEWQFYS